MVSQVKWPFAFVSGSDGAGVGWAVVHSRVVSPDRQEQFAALRRAGYRFAGMTSDVTFPALDGPDHLDYASVCEAWCHCFRDPEAHLPADVPRALVSDSDFTDPVTLSPSRRGSAPYDFVYVGASEPWKRKAKNWDLARRCLPRLARAGHRGLVIGVEPEETWPGVTFVPWLARPEFLACLGSARFLFAPNEGDASPKVLAEALCLDVPVLVNRRILGGWKYVNAFTGAFFEDEHDVASGAQRCAGITGSPRAWFCAHHGPYHAGRRVLGLLRTVDPGISERSHLSLVRELAAGVRPAGTRSRRAAAPLPSESSGSTGATSRRPTSAPPRPGART